VLRIAEIAATASRTIREGMCKSLLAGKSDAFELLDQVQALRKLGVTEGTLEEL
jgi:hypothetical protein